MWQMDDDIFERLAMEAFLARKRKNKERQKGKGDDKKKGRIKKDQV